MVKSRRIEINILWRIARQRLGKHIPAKRTRAREGRPFNKGNCFPCFGRPACRDMTLWAEEFTNKTQVSQLRPPM
jgi:hypothetical protein